jgi:Fic family protein
MCFVCYRFMFIQKRVIKGVEYKYLDHSFRLGDKIKKVSFILEKGKENYNDKIIGEIAKVKADYYFNNFETYFSKEELIKIETEKAFFQIFYNLLDNKSKVEILNEFARLFLTNSMKLEGSTITPQLAENIDRKKKIFLPKVEVRLYNNSKKALFNLMKTNFRSIIQFKYLHEEIFEGVLENFGNFKKLNNTFGYTEKAKTTSFKNVRPELSKLLQNKKEKEKNRYPFLRPLLFHLNYQKVHPFSDGNSRLGRILMVVQMFKLNYPPLIFKGDLNFQIRETLIEYINHNNLDFCRLAFEQYIITCQKFWRPMIKKYLHI